MKLYSLLFVFYLFNYAVFSQQNNKLYKSDVLTSMHLANNYFMTLWPNPATAIVHPDKTRPSNLWTRATYMEGLMQLYYLTGNQTIYQYAVDWGNFHKWQPTYVGTTLTRNGDNQCCGQTYIELYNIDPKPERIATMQKSIDNMVNSPGSNDWWWIDAIHMSMPVFAKFGKLYNDKKYYDKMYEMYSFPRYQVKKGKGLYNTTDKLWYRDSIYLPPKVSPNGLPVYWSRGNGWVFAALARVLEVLPEDEAHRSEYVQMMQDMASKLITIQREDGFWNPNLADPNDYGGKETSGTAFFVYGLAWGINNNILDSATYFPAMLKGWQGMVRDALRPDGSLGYVQSTGSKPGDGQPLSYTKMANFEDYGLGGFLLAGSEVYKLASKNDDYSDVKVLTSLLNFNVYPNSFTNELQISWSGVGKNFLLKIYNTLGAMIFSKQIDCNANNNFKWSTQNKSGGMFFVQIQSADIKIIKRVLLSGS